MEGKLKKIFEYQKFAGNRRLEKMLAEADKRSSKALTDEELSMVSAAGEMTVEITKHGNHS